MGSIMSLPSIALFYVSWVLSSITRPLVVATILFMVTDPDSASKKLKLILTSFQFLFLCKDKKWIKSNIDPASYFDDEMNDNGGDDTNKKEDDKDDDKDNKDNVEIKKKTLIFLRHGESTWNDTFNKGDRKTTTFLINFIPNLIKSFATEWWFLIRGQYNESWFYDSPLSTKGISQAERVKKFLKETNPQFSTPKEATLLRLMTGEDTKNKCQLVSSNLRRAISTLAIGLQDRLQLELDNDKILILSDLQEVSINPDALSISPPKQSLVSSFMDNEQIKKIYNNQTDTTYNDGNKSITSNGLLRMENFCNTIFNDITASSILATGHSYWFRAFFQTYLPYTFDHISKKKKLINGGIVGFTLLQKTYKETGEQKYMIDPKSIVVLYGGF